MLDFLRGKKETKDDLFSLDSADAVLKREAYDDCLSCRVFGKMTVVHFSC